MSGKSLRGQLVGPWALHGRDPVWGQGAAVVARLTVRPVCPQLRKCRVAGRPRDPREGAEYFPIIAADVPGQHLSQARRQKAYEAIEDAIEQDPIPVKDDVRINRNGAELGNHTRGLAHLTALPARAAAALLRWLDGGCATPRSPRAGSTMQRRRADRVGRFYRALGE
jgi:hypothetical protein